MCGRFTLLLGADDLAREFGLVFSGLHIEKRFNIAPGQVVIVVRPSAAGRGASPAGEGDPPFRFGLEPDAAAWGLVPSWSKDPRSGPRPINARAETLAEKPMFRGPFRHGRCIIPASGFYEWKAEGKGKAPWYIHPKGTSLFAFAGLSSRWEGPEGELRTCTIITTEPNALMRTLHDRMPAILPRGHWEEWLDPATRDPGALLVPFAEAGMEAHPVGAAVGNPRHDGPELIEPAAGLFEPGPAAD